MITCQKKKFLIFELPVYITCKFFYWIICLFHINSLGVYFYFFFISLISIYIAHHLQFWGILCCSCSDFSR